VTDFIQQASTRYYGNIQINFMDRFGVSTNPAKWYSKLACGNLCERIQSR